MRRPQASGNTEQFNYSVLSLSLRPGDCEVSLRVSGNEVEVDTHMNDICSRQETVRRP